MKLQDFFDKYSLNARAVPALLALLPLVAAIAVLIPKTYTTLLGLAGVLVTFGFVRLLGDFARKLGKQKEKYLLKKWGGWPSTIILRRSDTTLNAATKQRYHKFFNKNIDGWSLPSESQERNNLEEADARYRSAGEWLLERTRDTEKYSLLLSENITYGFRRNCLGLKWYGAGMAITSLSLILSSFLGEKVADILAQRQTELISGIFSTAMLLWWLFIVSETWVKDAAYGYA